MKVLVTGSTGFVGRHVVSRLLERGHEVTAVARDETKARKFAWFDRVRFIACDIHSQIDSPVERFGQPEAVMHLAWPGLPNYGALSHYEKTLPADYRFLKSLVQGGVGHLLVTGTCFEYGMQSGALTEDLPTAPANPYALAKDTLRKQLQSLQRQHAFILQWARLFYMYGDGQSPNSLLAQLDHAIDSGEAEFDMSGGEQLRDYLPVDKVASRTAALLEHPSCNGVVNVCSGEPISVRRLVEQHLASRRTNIRLNLGRYPYPDYEPMAFWGDASRLAAILQKS
jgi:dTDP-6-deoxy-L-talose 4-dehydrogenase (NAD+)